MTEAPYYGALKMFLRFVLYALAFDVLTYTNMNFKKYEKYKVQFYFRP